MNSCWRINAHLYRYLEYEAVFQRFGYKIFHLGDNTFVIEWFAGINCIILRSQIKLNRDASAER